LASSASVDVSTSCSDLVEGRPNRQSQSVSSRLTHPHPWSATAGLLIALALRLYLLDAYPLRDDEALYSSWALAARNDPLFLHTFPDKPPLFLWLQSIALALFGSTAAGARLLNIGAGVIAVALAMPAARSLWPQAVMSRTAGLVALWLMALNPFAISFAPTAYTDTVLACFFLAALVLGMRGQPVAAGAALGAAIMAKQQGLLFAPLILLLPLATGEQLPTSQRFRALGKMLAGVAIVTVPILLWDASRWATAPSPWDLGAQNYGVLRVASPSSWLPRAAEWAEPAWYLAATPWAWLILAGTVVSGLMLQRSRPRATAPVWLIAAWCAGFALLHLITTVQTWDRYLLPLVPLLALLAAGPIAGLAEALRARHWGVAGAAALLMLTALAPPAVTAARGGYPIGADHGALAGLDAAVDILRAESKAAAEADKAAPIIYQQRLGWQLGFYLANELQSGQAAVRWFASGAALADNAAKSPHRPLLLVEPAWAPSGNLALHLQARSLYLTALHHSGQVTIYRIEPSAGRPTVCTWCVNSLARLPDGWSRLPLARPAWTTESSAGHAPSGLQP